MSPIATLVTVAWSVCMSSVAMFTLLKPLDTVREWGETGVVPSNVMLERAPVPHGKKRFGGRNPQFTAMLPSAKLLWPLL